MTNLTLDFIIFLRERAIRLQKCKRYSKGFLSVLIELKNGLKMAKSCASFLAETNKPRYFIFGSKKLYDIFVVCQQIFNIHLDVLESLIPEVVVNNDMISKNVRLKLTNLIDDLKTTQRILESINEYIR